MSFIICINKIIVIFICLMCSRVKANYLKDNYPKDVIEDAALDTAQLIQKYQYPVETHYVTTEDKYILRLHRIPKPKAPPVLLMHGLQDSSATWILMGSEKSLGYYLADNGYDVWMANNRGNRYSRNHTLLNPNTDAEFWKFSFHEIGLFDLAASIDYVLEQTGYKQIVYFGHSQGTTAFWVLCSMRPEYNDKISLMHALAPSAFMKNIKTPILELGNSFFAAFNKQLTEILPYTDEFYKMCFTSRTSEEICVGMFNQIVGIDNEQINRTMYPVIFGHLPSGSSFQQFDHYRQLIASNRFCQYDFGKKENLHRYGKPEPPEYPLKNITVPVALYYAYNDYLSSEVDVKRLAKMLPNVVENTPYPYKSWNHMTMLWGKDVRELAHKRMLEIMKSYS